MIVTIKVKYISNKLKDSKLFILSSPILYD